MSSNARSDDRREDASSGKSYADAYGLGGSAKKQSSAGEGKRLRLNGVDHTARPTWKLRETVEFYRDIMGLHLVHTISARGWGPPGHHDFLHFFFSSGKDSTIAFFYYLGAEQPDKYKPDMHHFSAATHTAWSVESEAELIAWKQRLEDRGWMVSPFTRHEILESIYFLDPNGYPVEITRRLRDIAAIDGTDAALTLEAAMQVVDEAQQNGESVDQIDQVWRRKAKLVAQRYD